MNTNWKKIATEILSEHVGAFAEIVVEDAAAACRMSPSAQPQAFVVEFVLRVSQELPDTVSRGSIAAELRAALK